jgi:hypothetical protein
MSYASGVHWFRLKLRNRSSKISWQLCIRKSNRRKGDA